MSSRGLRPFNRRGRNVATPAFAEQQAIEWFVHLFPDGDFPPLVGASERAQERAGNVQRMIRNLNATGFPVYG